MCNRTTTSGFRRRCATRIVRFFIKAAVVFAVHQPYETRPGSARFWHRSFSLAVRELSFNSTGRRPRNRTFALARDNPPRGSGKYSEKSPRAYGYCPAKRTRFRLIYSRRANHFEKRPLSEPRFRAPGTFAASRSIVDVIRRTFVNIFLNSAARTQRRTTRFRPNIIPYTRPRRLRDS